MGKYYDHITQAHRDFISKQHMFFVSTAPLSGDGRINLSPKGLDSFRVISDDKVAYLDLVGSGNETAAHILENQRITVMFCAFDGPPNILRIYGKGYAVHKGSEEWDALSPSFTEYPGTRQIIVADVIGVATSCGYGIPLYEHKTDRDIYFTWAEKKGPEGLEKYVKENNAVSIEGLETGIVPD